MFFRKLPQRVRSAARPASLIPAFLAACLTAILAIQTIAAGAPLLCRAGAERADITPDEPVRLSGFAGRLSPFEGIESRLYARVLAIQDADGVLSIIVSAESIGIPGAVRERICGNIRPRLGAYHERVAIASTNSRSAPALRGVLDGLLELSQPEQQAVERYTRSFESKIIAAINRAVARMEPAALHSASTPIPGAAGAPGARLRAVEVVRADRSVLAVLFHTAARAAALSGEFNLVSGDWPGAAAARFEAAHPGCLALPLIGCAADAPVVPGGGLQSMREEASRISSALEGILAARAPSEAAAAGRIDAQFEYISLPPAPDAENLPAQGREAAFAWPAQVMILGGGPALIFLGGEVEREYAGRLERELAPLEVLVCSHANDSRGYLASRQSHAERPEAVAALQRAHGLRSGLAAGAEDAAVAGIRSLVARGSAALPGRVKPPPPLEPLEALKSLQVIEGFEVELAACEPQVADPVALAFDGDGRMYVCEMRDYPLGPGAGKPFDGRVRRLEDADGDGRYESSSMFCENVPFPTGIAPHRGGVFVTCAPDLIYLKDADGDGRAEIRETVFTGFNVGNSQHLLNSLSTGLDNWIYVNGGDFASIRRPGGETSGQPALLTLSHANFRFLPGSRRVESATGYRGGFGQAFDDFNSRIVCESTDHALQVMLDGARLARNPDLAVDSTIQRLSDHGQEVFPRSKPLQRFNDPSDVGRFSSSCGVCIYDGDRFPEPYRGSLFVCEPVSNLVHRDELAPAGAAYRAHRGEAGREFLTSADHWFRPVNCATGPDGALYIIDMYREVIEHPEWIPIHIQKMFDLRSGMDRGRIYRIVHRGAGAGGGKGSGAARAAASGKPALEAAVTAALAADLGHPSGWRRRTAQRLLVERGGRDALAALEGILAGQPAAGGDAAAEERGRHARLHALWVLEGLGELRPGHVEKALGDPSAAVRACAAFLAERFIGRPEAASGPAPEEDAGRRRLAGTLEALADDPDARVRCQAAFSLGALEAGEKIQPFARMARRDASDPWMQTALLTGLNCDPAPLLDELLGGPEAPDPAFLRRLAGLIGARRRPAEIQRALRSLTGAADRRAGWWILPPLADLFRKMRPLTLKQLAAAAGPGDAEDAKTLRRLLERVGQEARNELADLGLRLQGIELLGNDDSGGALAILSGCFDARYPADLQAAAVRSIAQLPGAARADATALLIGKLPRSSPQVRRELLDVLVQDADRSGALLDAVEAGSITARDLDLQHRRALEERAGIQERARRLLAAVAVDPQRARVVEDYAGAMRKLPGAGNAVRGRELFTRTCAVCHHFKGAGAVVGPDLSTVANRDPEALAIDILDPSRSVSPEYLSYVLTTRDQRIITGLLVTETPGNVVLRRAEGKSDSILRKDIADLRSTTLSVMPDGLEQQASPEDVRDIIAFIRE